MSDASFRIDQAAPGTVDVARRDLKPFSVDGAISFVAVNPGHTYRWEITQAPGSSAPVTGATSQTCSIDAEVRGGYSVKLTTNEGTASEEINELYFGIPFQMSGLAAPALNETIQDNSQGTPEQGWWEKMFGWMVWVEDYIATDYAVAPEMGIYYVNFENGHDDHQGDGSIQRPWKTLWHACSELESSDLTDYMTPILIRLAPGTYDHTGEGAPLDIPKRLVFAVEGLNCTIEGDINWHQDAGLAWWTDNLPAALYFGTPSVTSFYINGDIHCQNETPDEHTPGPRGIGMDKVVFNGNIHNAKATTLVDDTKGTGKLYLALLHAQFVGGEYIFGEAEDPSVGESNTIYLRAYDSYIAQGLYGYIGFDNVQNCFFDGDIRYDWDPVAVSAGYSGRIDGGVYGPPFAFASPGNIITCGFKPKDIFVGDDGTVPGVSDPIEMDVFSYAAMFVVGDPHVRFDNIDRPRPIDSVAPGQGIVYVDQQYGIDRVYAGTPERPYKTLPYAFSQVGDATTEPEFQRHYVYKLAPGEYSLGGGIVTLPRRLTTTIEGDNALIHDGELVWDYDKTLWGSLDPTEYRNQLNFTSDKPHGLIIDAPLTGINGVPTQEGNLTRILAFDNCDMRGTILNRNSGGADLSYLTGTLALTAHNSKFGDPASPGYIGGMYEEDTGSGYAINLLQVTMVACQVHHKFAGVVAFVANANSFFEQGVSYDTNPSNGATGYGGNIGSRQASRGQAFSDCVFAKEVDYDFGWDDTKENGDLFPAPFPVGYDEVSFRRVHILSNSTPHYYNMELGFMTLDNQCSENVYQVSNGGTPKQDGISFLTWYNLARNATPHGQPLGPNNRVSLLVPPGDYELPSINGVDPGPGWWHQYNFVDIIGQGGEARRNNVETPAGPDPDKIQHTGVRFTHNVSGPGNNHVAVINADDSLVQGIHFDQTLDSIEAADINPTGGTPSRGNKLRIIGCSFTVLGATTPHQNAVTNTDEHSDAYFEECHADAGWYLGDFFEGKCIRCTAGAYGFNNASPAATPAYFEDCHAGDFSFDGDPGNGFDSIAKRCSGGENSFGAEYFKGDCEDCFIIPGKENGFGVGGATTPHPAAKLRNCYALDLTASMKYRGLMIGCMFRVVADSTPVLEVYNVDFAPPIFRRCVFEIDAPSTPADYTIVSGSTPPDIYNMRMSHCEIDEGALGYIEPGYLNNQIGDGHNVESPYVKCTP
jgi:hypothetical protein